jgi:hypothetical protein
MKINSIQHAAQVLQALIIHRQKAYEAKRGDMRSGTTHPAFEHIANSQRVLRPVAAGEVQVYNVKDIIKYSPGMYYVAKKKNGQVIPTQKEKLDSCLDYLRGFIHSKREGVKPC